MTIFKNIAFVLLVLLTIASCTSKYSEQRDMVTKWSGKEILFPSDMQFQIQADSIDYDFVNADYKIITYIDSANCIPCQMRLSLWDNVINEFKSIPDIQINFVMVINGRNRKMIESNLKQCRFNNLVCINESGSFDKANHLPKGKNYHTFLLDDKNRVIAIGNPATNPRVKELFESVIFKDLGIDSITKNKLCKNSVYNLGLVNITDTLSVDFELNNTDDKTYHI